MSLAPCNEAALSRWIETLASAKPRPPVGAGLWASAARHDAGRLPAAAIDGPYGQTRDDAVAALLDASVRGAPWWPPSASGVLSFLPPIDFRALQGGSLLPRIVAALRPIVDSVATDAREEAHGPSRLSIAAPSGSGSLLARHQRLQGVALDPVWRDQVPPAWTDFWDGVVAVHPLARAQGAGLRLYLPLLHVDLYAGRIPALFRMIFQVAHPRVAFLLVGDMEVVKSTLQRDLERQQVAVGPPGRPSSMPSDLGIRTVESVIPCAFSGSFTCYISESKGHA